MILIYIPNKTRRIEYTWNFIFKQATFIEYRITSFSDEYKQYLGPKFEYSSQKQFNGTWLWASGLLNEETIQHHHTESFHDEWGKILFPSEHKHSLLPFDLPSAVFWLITRYEEYILETTDKHSRFIPQQSWLYKNNLLNTPIVNVWINRFVDILKKSFADLAVQYPRYNFVSTIDIDNLFACKGKPFFKNIFNLHKALLFNRSELALNGLRYYISKKPDPFDSYDFIIQTNKLFQVKPVFFILTSTKTKYDRNLAPHHPLFIKTVQTLSQNADIGIHLSYYSYEKHSVASEKNQLEKIIGSKIVKNRFHFLRFKIPYSYKSLIEIGILEDYSMLYSQCTGFRSGTCTPFYFFDLQNNFVSPLKIYTVPFMDKHLPKTEEAVNQAHSFIDVIKKYHGTFVLLWHNETLPMTGTLRSNYQKIIEKAAV